MAEHADLVIMNTCILCGRRVHPDEAIERCCPWCYESTMLTVRANRAWRECMSIAAELQLTIEDIGMRRDGA